MLRSSQHEAYIPPVRPTAPKVKFEHRVYNPIDAFVISRLDGRKLKPAPAAERQALIRRVTFDLIGLPPTVAEMDAFVNDPASLDAAYEKVVDRLLKSPHYGEQMARFWLDAARYADTSGYQYDREREHWVWRDWVIHAFNSNLPFDQFTIQQIAGDMLPDATDQTRLATGFNRNHPITIEGGVVDEEYRTEYVIDRVVTTSTVWLGQTFLCARCHDHKYDPVTQEEFYQFYSFFNNVPERGLKGFDPKLTLPSPLNSTVKDFENESKKPSVFPATMVMSEMPEPRQAYVLQRGEYDKPMKDRPVEPAVPDSIGSLPKTAPQNRLGLAQWLVARDQPLTARVTVNRFWQRLFGVGLVKTSEDFGSQGEYPSHPDLLDWLADEFMSSGWDVKRILKTIVMSNTYRQSSHLTDEAYTLDPENRMLARGPRTRLDGEVIRDSALAVSGLLDTTVGGPSVYPYHPQGLWLEINNRPNYSRAYPHQTDPHQHHRRTLYTFWKRTVPPPSVATFDAPSREYCVVRRSSTNTPLQAFVMLHDPQFVEAARHLAVRMIKEGGEQLESQITFGFRCCTSRTPNDKERRILLKTYSQRIQEYKNNTKAADQLLSVGVSPVDDTIDRAELAAMTQVARMLMNLSEFLTKG